MLKKILRSRRDAKNRAKAEVKAAKTRAKAEVKARSQLTKSQTKLLNKQEAKLRKAEAKGLKAKQKHEMKLAETKLKQMQAGRINRANVARVLGAAQLAAPIVVPLAYQVMTKLRDAGTQAQAKQLGITPERLGQHSGHGAPVKARIAGIKESLASSGLPSGFVRDMRDRLDKLADAADNAEFLTPDKRRQAHRSITSDVDAVVAEIDKRHH